MTSRAILLIAIFALLSACMHPRAIEAPAEVQLTPLKTISTLQSDPRQADVTAVEVGAVGHDPSMLAAAPLILTWLGELDAAAERL